MWTSGTISQEREPEDNRETPSDWNFGKPFDQIISLEPLIYLWEIYKDYFISYSNLINVNLSIQNNITYVFFFMIVIIAMSWMYGE